MATAVPFFQTFISTDNKSVSIIENKFFLYYFLTAWNVKYDKQANWDQLLLWVAYVHCSYSILYV